jgi:hypothetical protein
MTNAAAMTLAAQMAVRALKQKLRDDGRRQHEIFTSDVRKSIAGYLRDHPECFAKAQAMIETNPAFAKFRTSAQKPRR